MIGYVLFNDGMELYQELTQKELTKLIIKYRFKRKRFSTSSLSLDLTGVRYISEIKEDDTEKPLKPKLGFQYEGVEKKDEIITTEDEPPVPDENEPLENRPQAG